MTENITNARQVLTINCGSSSLKFAVYRLAAANTETEDNLDDSEALVFTGVAERIGLDNGVFHVADASHRQLVYEELGLANHREALHHVLHWLESQLEGHLPDAIGHRIVHGGSLYSRPTRITDDVLAALRRLAPLAPTHLPAEIEAIETLRQQYPTLPQAACFDTAFHRRMPRVAQLYGLPRHYTDEGILRYGFHGLSYEYILSELEHLWRQNTTNVADERIIIAHLGNGASMVAIRDGHSIDTTMGLTPIGGLVMSTRSGDLDPGVLLYLLEADKLPPTEVRTVVEQRGGLLGLSETSSDMQDLLLRMHQDAHAEEAVALFCYNAKKQLGGLVSVLGGVSTLVFTGGIGEHAAEVRRRICDGLEFLGIHLDLARNTAGAAIISPENNPVTIQVIPTNEELMIARHTVRVLNSSE